MGEKDIVMDVSDRIKVLNYGQKITEGLPGGTKQSEEVIESYLWKEERHYVA